MILGLFLLSGCSGERPLLTARVLSPALPLSFSRVTIDLPPGHIAGSYGFGLFCLPPYQDVAWISEGRMPGLLANAARDGLNQAGIGLTPGAQRALSARLVDVDLDLCRRADMWFGKSIGTTGDGRIRVEWEITRPQMAPIRISTDGKGGTDIPSLDKRHDLILRAAMLDAAAKLVAHTDFQAARYAVATPSPILAPDATSVPVPMVANDPPEDDAVTPAPGHALVRQGERLGLIIDAAGWVLMAGETASDTPLILEDGRVVAAQWQAAGFGLSLLRLPAGDWPASSVRRQRPAVSHWLHRIGGDRVALVSSHAGPDHAQGAAVPGLLLDLDEDLWRDPPWFLVDDQGRLAAIRGARVLPGDLAPYHAASGILAWARSHMPAAGASAAITPPP